MKPYYECGNIKIMYDNFGNLFYMDIFTEVHN